jgi:hypothetical protein
MSVELRNSPGQPGYVHLIFDRRIDVDRLRLAFCNRISQTYLGHSIGKANWSTVRSHFFDAVLVSRGDHESVFSIGPEVSSFIADETTVELTTKDDAIREVVIWSGILLEFHWNAPVELKDEAGTRSEAKIRRDRDEAQQVRSRIETETQKDVELERWLKEAQAAEQENARCQAMLARQQQEAENERRRIAVDRAEADKKRQAEAEKLEKEAEEKSAAEASEIAEAERASTTLADLFTPLRFGDLSSAVRTPLRRWPKNEVDDGVAHGRQAWLRWRPLDSFFSVPLWRCGSAARRRKLSSS